MWDKPRLLNAIADALFAAAGLVVLAAAAWQASRLPAFALREVQVSGDVRHVTREQVEELVARRLEGNFLTVDLGAVRSAFERLPWVRSARVRRHWPGRLDVELEEHVPFARWAAGALVDSHGELFHAAYDGELPLFSGPPGAAREIAIQYRYFRRALAPAGERPVAVHVSERRAWTLRLESGLTLALGREHIESRLARFAAAYGRTLRHFDRRVDYVDLRYANGFAVRVPGRDDETRGRDRAAKKAGKA